MISNIAPLPSLTVSTVSRVHPLERRLPLRHSLPAHERLLGGLLHLRSDLGFHLLEALCRDSLPLQILLVQADRVAFPPLLEQGVGKRVPRLPLVVRGVAAHAKRLGHEQRRALPGAAARGRD